MRKRTIILMVMAALLAGGCTAVLSGAAGEFDTGMGYFNRGDFQQAAGHFARATELEPEYGEAHLYLGRSYLNLGRWGEAVGPLRTAYRLAPGETQKEIGAILFDALLPTALGKIRQGNFNEGISYLQEGLELDPQSGRVQDEIIKAWIAYGEQLLQNGNATEAINAFQEALGYNEENADAHIGLARAFLMNGNWAKAREMAFRALSLSPDSSSLEELFRMLVPPQR